MSKRRHFLTQATLTATGAVALNACRRQASNPEPNPAVASANPSIRWRMATSWSKSLDIAQGAAETVCRRVSAMTGGRFTITPYAAGEIVPGLEVMDAVQEGTVECGHTASYYYVSKNPALAFGTSVPFGLTPQQQNAWFYQGGGLEAMQKLYEDFGIINFPAGNTGTQMGGWFRQEIQTVEDLQGLKMRIPGLGGEVMKRLGVDVQVLLGSEIFEALSSGEIEAAEWVGPYEDEKLGLNKIAPFYYYPSWWEPGTTYEVQVNRQAWESLPRTYQAILKAATVEANVRMLAQYDAANGEALKRLVLGGTQLIPYTSDILQACRTAAFEWYEDNASQDSGFRAIYDQWKAFREQVYGWNRINTLSHANFVVETLTR